MIPSGSRSAGNPPVVHSALPPCRGASRRCATVPPVDPLATQLGILTTLQLMAGGWTKWQIESAARRGALRRVRPGWFARPQPDPAALAAVAAGGCVSCFSALRLHGAWVPEGIGAHRRFAEHRGRRGGARRCRPYGAQPPVRAAVDGLEVAFRCALRCGSDEQLVVVIDSLLHRRLATREQLEGWMRSAPMRLRVLLERADARAESGTESMVRLRLRSLRIATRIQVRVMEGVRVDLLIGDRLVIECDSREHHADAAAYERDRRRDRRLVARGFLVIRLSYRQIHDEWEEVERDLLAIVRAGGHRLPRRRRIPG